jgi:hypothetical protein
MMEQNLKMGSKMSIATLFCLLLGSILYYQERIIFSDAAWVVYNIINKKELFIIEHRYGAFISQIFPLIGGYLGLSLSTILLLYSISFTIFYLSTALYLHWIKQYSLSILLGFYYTICCTSAYYWTNNEVHQATAWLMIFLGSTLHHEAIKSNRLFSYALFTLLAFLAIFSHPLILFSASFLWGFLYLEKKEGWVAQKSFWFYTLILVIILSIKLYMSQKGWYDGEKISNIKSANWVKISSAMRSYTAKEFLHHLVYSYWQMTLIILASYFVLIATKRVALALWMTLYLLLFFISICLTYPDKTIHFYIESEWMSISIIACFAFVRIVLPLLHHKLSVALLLAIFSFRLYAIAMAASPFEKHLHELNTVVSKHQNNQETKIVYTNRNAHLDDRLMMSWALPIETLLLSNLTNKKPSVTAILMSEEEYQNRKIKDIDKDIMIEPFEILKLEKINKNYFRIDTCTRYKIDQLEWR